MPLGRQVGNPRKLPNKTDDDEPPLLNSAQKQQEDWTRCPRSPFAPSGRRISCSFDGIRPSGVITMRKYEYEFEPVAGRPDWFIARDLEGDAAEAAAKRVHGEFELGSELVFCGLPPDGGADRLFLLESGDPARSA
jgi:hypothetical protein